MKLTQYSHPTLSIIVTICLVVISMSSVGFLFLPPILPIILLVLAIAFLLFTLNFFRDPDRKTDTDPTTLISPADGKVVLIKDLDSHEGIDGPCTLVAIFMSPLNVHVNRIPISGVVTKIQYHKGKFLRAWEDKASTENERSEITIQSEFGTVIFKQIAGYVARRIIYVDLAIQKKVIKGDRFGMIKFGSRVDLILPKGWSVEITKNNATIAGETIIARWIQ